MTTFFAAVACLGVLIAYVFIFAMCKVAAEADRALDRPIRPISGEHLRNQRMRFTSESQNEIRRKTHGSMA